MHAVNALQFESLRDTTLRIKREKLQRMDFRTYTQICNPYRRIVYIIKYLGINEEDKMKVKFKKLGFQCISQSGIIQEVSSLSSEQRYKYTMEQIAKSRKAWTLCAEDGDSIVLDAYGENCICIWPDDIDGQPFLKTISDECGRLVPVKLEELIDVAEQLTKSMHYAFAIYPTSTDMYVVSPCRLLEDLGGNNLLLKPKGGSNEHVAK